MKIGSNYVVVKSEKGSYIIDPKNVTAKELAELRLQLKKDKKVPNDAWKPSTISVIGGIAAGQTAKGLVGQAKKPISLVLMSKVRDIGKSLTDKDLEIVQKSAQKALKESGLKAKGVNIINVNFSDKIGDLFKKEFDSMFIGKFLPKKLKENVANMHAATIKYGCNACYLPNVKKVLVPKGKNLSLSVFHEMGHAMNANFSKIGNLLQKTRGLSLLAIPIAAIALFKSKKPDGMKPEGIVDKTTTFVKENAGKLTFASFLPMLIEEGMASIKGNKLAAKYLNPQLAAKVAKTNKIAYLTYLSGAVLAGAGIYVATKIKDMVSKPKKV